MERKVSRTGVVGLTVCRALSFAACIALATPANAGGGGIITGGATEITQLANNSELIAQVSEAIQTTANTLMTAQSTIQMLRQLPETLIREALSGLPIEAVEALSDAYTVMSDAIQVYKDAEEVFRQAEQAAESLGITLSELLQEKANAAAMFGGVYKQVYEEEIAKIRRLAKTSEEVQKQINIVKSIDSNVGGIQVLAGQNIQLQSLLASISESIAKANYLASMEAAKLKKEEADRLNAEALADEEFRRNQAKAQAERNAITTDGIIRH